MDERRTKLRRHIQAARSWLQQADRSLEKENDVQGDLKLMLAKAELAQASQRQAWIKRLLPPIAALIIAAGFLFMNRSPINNPPDAEIITAGAPIVTAADSVATIDPSKVMDDSPPLLDSSTIEQPIDSSSFDQPLEPPIDYDVAADYVDATDYNVYDVPRDVEVDTYETAVEPEPPIYYEDTSSMEVAAESIAPTYAYEVSLPDEDIQRLMVDAEQILRAK